MRVTAVHAVHSVPSPYFKECMMSKIKISNWDTRQSFRADRGAPPWIKIYRNIMSNPKWLQLTDSEKGQVVSMWVIAADTKGELVHNEKLLMKICQLDSEPNISKFIELGFMTSTCQPDVNQMTTKCQPNDAPEKRQRRDRVDESREEKIIAYDDIVTWWNDLSEKYKLTKIKVLSPKRKTSLKLRIKEIGDIDTFKTSIYEAVSNSTFLQGQNNTGWRCDFDFILKQKSFIKMIEGGFNTVKKLTASEKRLADFQKIRDNREARENE